MNKSGGARGPRTRSSVVEPLPGLLRNAGKEFQRQMESLEARPAKSDLVRQTVFAQVGQVTLADVAVQLPAASPQC